MTPKSKHHSRQPLYQEWHRTLNGPWPTHGVFDQWNSLQSWSDDLLINQSNPHWAIGKVRGDIGGDFWVLRREYSESSTLGPGRIHFSPTSNPMEPGTHHVVANQFSWTNGFGNSTFPAVSPSPDHVLDALGAVAIHEVRPTKPEADLGTFLGELREGLPQVVGFAGTGKGRTDSFRRGGSEYVNYKFGWEPLAREIRAFADVIKNSERMLDDYIANAGKRYKVKKRWAPELSTSRWIEHNTLSHPLMPTWAYRGSGYYGTKAFVVREFRQRWFEGVMRYYIPPVGTFQRRTSEANRLLGTTLDAETVWNLAPWSWAADWVANIGSIAGNMSAFANEGLVMEYGYMMETKSSTFTVTTTGLEYTSYPGSQTLSQTFKTTSKKRVTANPYGFGVVDTDLSNQQLAILTALGFSRGR